MATTATYQTSGTRRIGTGKTTALYIAGTFIALVIVILTALKYQPQPATPADRSGVPSTSEGASGTATSGAPNPAAGQ